MSLPNAMIRMMIGRDLKSLHVPAERAPGAALLEVAGLAERHDGRWRIVRNRSGTP